MSKLIFIYRRNLIHFFLIPSLVTIFVQIYPNLTFLIQYPNLPLLVIVLLLLSTNNNSGKSEEGLPTPEGPIREDNIQGCIIPTIPKQWWWARIGPIISICQNNRPIHAIKHHLQIRHHPRVPPQ